MAISEQRDLTGLKAGAFDALLGTEEIGIAILDTDLRYREVNPLLAKFNGVSVEDHIGQTVAEVLPALAPVVVPELNRVLETGTPLRDLRITGQTPSLKGQDSLWEASYLPIVEPANDNLSSLESEHHVTGILVLAINRSLEQELERAKEESHQLQRRILDSLFTFVGILSPDGVLIDANRAPLEAAGVSLEDVMGKRFWDCIWWNYSPSIQQQLRNAVIRAGAGETVRYDVPVRTVGDTRITIDFMITPLLGKEGEVTHLVASANDISERKSRETELILSEKRFRRVFDSTADGLVMINEYGEVMLANASMANMFGYTMSELYSCTVEDLIPAHKRNQHRQDRMRYQENPVPRAMAAMRELMASRKDGSEFPVEIALTPLQFPEGTRVLATVVDISIQKQIQASLIKALKEKTSLLNEVHHRVKNNLQVVSSLLSLQANSLPDELAEHFQESQSRVKAMALMHQQLYEHKTYESIGAAKYISELVALIQRSHSGTSGWVETRLIQPETEVYLTMDQALPFGLLLNELLTNSMKHAFKGLDGGEITISLQKLQNITTVTIEDNGVGIPEDVELGETQSLGFQLIPGLVDQLEGKIALIRGQGTRYEICFEAGGNLE
ncbi:MAG: PAS domain S-box protein [Thalassolituus sp.]|nr:MAG: PAS domain S-box protein [Thalassolituus sp.]